MALITQLCPKRHAHVFIHIKVISCPGPGPPESILCISQHWPPACQARMLPAQISRSHRLSQTGFHRQSYQDNISHPNREVFRGKWNPRTQTDILHNLYRGQYSVIIYSLGFQIGLILFPVLSVTTSVILSKSCSLCFLILERGSQ